MKNEVNAYVLIFYSHHANISIFSSKILNQLIYFSILIGQCPSDYPYAYDYIAGPRSYCCNVEPSNWPDNPNGCTGSSVPCPTSPLCDDHLTGTV